MACGPCALFCFLFEQDSVTCGSTSGSGVSDTRAKQASTQPGVAGLSATARYARACNRSRRVERFPQVVGYRVSMLRVAHNTRRAHDPQEREVINDLPVLQVGGNVPAAPQDLIKVEHGAAPLGKQWPNKRCEPKPSGQVQGARTAFASLSLSRSSSSPS